MNKFLIGLVFGIAIAGGLAVYLNNQPMQFMKKNVVVSPERVSSAPIILEPGTKIREEDSTRVKAVAASKPISYDFYDVLQERHVLNTSDAQKVKASANSKVNANASSIVKNTRFIIQAGAFSDRELASDMKGRLALIGIDSVIKTQQNGDNTVHRVLIGPISSEAKAQSIINQLSDQQIDAALIRLNSSN
ncbi:MAG: hypothetical protein QG673_863 [Pseudomonadota bacterium]|nr:hypothetical protein [Pseudomonadota bacterium]